MNTWRSKKNIFLRERNASEGEKQRNGAKICKKKWFLERNALGKKTMTNKNVTLTEK